MALACSDLSGSDLTGLDLAIERPTGARVRSKHKYAPPTCLAATPAFYKLTMGGEPLVSLTNRTVAAGSRILVEGLSLTVRSNEYWAILGPNGSGKSATAKQLFYRLLAGESTQIGSTSVAGGTAGLGSYVSFERQRRLLHQEAREFSQSRFESRHKRASVASFLFPELYPRYPDDIEYGWRPPRTRLTPLPVPYDADSDHPLLAQLEAAACSGNAGRLLRAFDLLPSDLMGQQDATQHCAISRRI